MIQVLRRGLTILEYLAVQPDVSRGLGEIAAVAKLNPATAARIMKTLCNAGYAEQLGRKKGYILGSMAYALSAKGEYRKDLSTRALPHMQRLADMVGESTVLAVLKNGKRLVLREVEPDRPVVVRMNLPQNYNPFASATGRMLIAHSDERELEQAVRAYPDLLVSWSECDGLEPLQKALAQIREQGFSERMSREVVGIACPVMERGGVFASLGVYLPRYRYEGAHKADVYVAMRQAVQEISVACATQAS